MTQMLAARAGEITTAMKRVAEKEGLSPEFIRQGVAEGSIVIPANINHRNLDPVGFGKGLKTKVNANIGTSTSFTDIEKELEKLKVVLEAGADAVMDLSTGGEIDQGRRRIIEESTIAVGTVPIYQSFLENRNKRGSMIAMTADDLFEVVERHCSDGVDFITVHCGITLEVLERIKKQSRITDIVSRGGSFLTGWMLHHGKENPLYEQFDRLLDICLKYDVTLSLGDGLRPGCLADATDRAQIQELIILGELVDKAREKGVQAMVEGPGHVPLDQIRANIEVQKTLCKGAPFYVLGPLVTDVAPGYDHITAAIGGTVAAAAGADFLCYVTPAEHLGLPTLEDVREGIMASRIAAHAADIVKGIPGALEWDKKMARARKALDWDEQIKLAIDPQRAAKIRQERNPDGHEACTMCGDFCAMKIVAQYLGKEPESC
ncbi:hydroxymethylpyrimidine synthase [Desulforamulus reducens MI-1]|uniref:Phosphomethylpyrimidine synthase n=1 Tax=Desulforamulus reducens (strain ATCC BAA-1160 / DSM 100696 / MI-1) TaxID=349161 RepID=THIC_DESRM|nr:phosphomethylpyrimidine synthase ThiC [Desulforamulus reducens]A4J8J1.1 RecName: Full=Phosphomethylpyrimidine synthase; AltName: Full=Hydroxymethylpyrimidine phosphate synthase; Short=HMP-P synthase; Short=HMP-phosphate synthase; Short=HMPP synthase; AltName: Full=Thiamine biosynthesis protein ThiC [Desulforamulus reducens MI-1]ABO51394.1 hydroxymethylpyrimidine synthase [Desulforamulus reducens MI-1]